MKLTYVDRTHSLTSRNQRVNVGYLNNNTKYYAGLYVQRINNGGDIAKNATLINLCLRFDDNLYNYITKHKGSRNIDIVKVNKRITGIGDISVNRYVISEKGKERIKKLKRKRLKIN